MKQYHLTVTSKTKKSLDDFFYSLSNHINFIKIKKNFKNKKTKKIFTILKSPHVYKTAQEQFQSNFFSSKITIYSSDNFPFLIFLKKIKNNLFPDLKVKIKFLITKSNLEKTQTIVFNPTNFKLNILNKVTDQRHHTPILKKKNNKQIESLLKIFDIYGELAPKRLFG